MGYTHYWYRDVGVEVTDEQWEAICSDFENMLTKFEADEGPVVTIGHDKRSAMDRIPALTVNQDMIVFNGIGPDAHETMWFERNPNLRPHNTDRMVFGFCKTAGKPYDTLVTALLVAVVAHAPDAWVVSSDGYFEDWKEGIKLYEKVTGDKCPNMEGLEFRPSRKA